MACSSISEAPTPVGGAHRWLPASPCDPSCIPPRVEHGVLAAACRIVRTTRRLAAVGAVLGAGLVLAAAVPVMPAPTVARVQRRWALTLVAATGLRVHRHGRGTPAGGTLVVANHVSWLDVLLLHAVAPVRMLAKKEVRTWPLIGSMAARVGTVFLDRDRLRDLPGAVGLLAAALASGTPVGLFAEGTTRCGRDLGPFRPAAFQAAIDAGVPIQPVALTYRSVEDTAGHEASIDHSAAFVGDDTLWASLWRVVSAPRLVVDVDVLPALSSATARSTGGREASAAPRRRLARQCSTAVAGALPRPVEQPDEIPAAPAATAAPAASAASAAPAASAATAPVAVVAPAGDREPEALDHVA